jgi:hypothetical protein
MSTASLVAYFDINQEIFISCLAFLDAVASIRRQLNEERQQAITSMQNVTRNSRSSNAVSIYSNNIVLQHILLVELVCKRSSTDSKTI